MQVIIQLFILVFLNNTGIKDTYSVQANFLPSTERFMLRSLDIMWIVKMDLSLRISNNECELCYILFMTLALHVTSICVQMQQHADKAKT